MHWWLARWGPSTLLHACDWREVLFASGVNGKGRSSNVPHAHSTQRASGQVPLKQQFHGLHWCFTAYWRYFLTQLLNLTRSRIHFILVMQISASVYTIRYKLCHCGMRLIVQCGVAYWHPLHLSHNRQCTTAIAWILYAHSSKQNRASWHGKKQRCHRWFRDKGASFHDNALWPCPRGNENVVLIMYVVQFW